MTLTGIAVFGDTTSTGVLGTGGWNTACNGPVGQLSIAGYSTCPLSVDISTPNTYTFSFHGSGNVPDTYADLELFFNDATNTPGIHLVIDRSSPSTFWAATATPQQCLYYNAFDPGSSCSPNPAGPGSLTYSTGTLLVTALGFSANTDWSGQIQFSVTPVSGVPEPGTAFLLAAGCVALLALVRRQQ